MPIVGFLEFKSVNRHIVIDRFDQKKSLANSGWPDLLFRPSSINSLTAHSLKELHCNKRAANGQRPTARRLQSATDNKPQIKQIGADKTREAGFQVASSAKICVICGYSTPGILPSGNYQSLSSTP